MRKSNIFVTIALLLSLVLVLVGQFFLPQPEWTYMGIIYFTGVAFLFLWVLISRPIPHGITAPYHPYKIPRQLLLKIQRVWRLVLIIILAILLLFAFMLLGNNQFTKGGTAAWLGTIAVFLLLTMEVPADWRERSRGWWAAKPWQVQSWQFHFNRIWFVFLVILLLAAFFRFYRLDSLPKEMGSDQAEKLLDVYDVLTGRRPIFFPRNTGREMVQFYLTAGIIRLTGLQIGFLPLKMGTALVSLLTVPFVFLLGRELYGRNVGLLTITFLAVAHWHVSISRIGLRFPFTAAFVSPTLLFLFRALKYNRRNDWLACGLVLGVGLHTYIPMRMVPLLLIVVCLLKLLLDGLAYWRQRTVNIASAPDNFPEASSLNGRFWLNAVLGGVASLIVFWPLLRYMYDEPTMFWFRVATRALENGNEVTTNVWPIFWDNVKNALLMFNYRGDAVVSNSIPFTPFLGLVSGGLFVLGVVYLLWRLLKHGDRRTIYVLTALFIMLLPSILSFAFPGENPSAVRTGGTIPLAMLIAALPLWVILKYFVTLWDRKGVMLAGVVTAVLLALAIRDNYNYYFVRYDEHFHHSLLNTSEMGGVARGFADSIGDLDHVYHIAYPWWVDTRLIGIYAGDITWHNAVFDAAQEIPKIHAPDPDPKLYILHLEDQESLDTLRRTYPAGWAERYQSAQPSHKDFIIFFVPNRAP